MADIILTEADTKRFWLKTRWNPWNGCLEWTAKRMPTGYGRFSLNMTRKYAHRVAWVACNGGIPEGLCVCHRCDNPPCVNPDHLFLATHTENIEDRDRKGRGRYSANPPSATCMKGHIWRAWSTRVDSSGHRCCKRCEAVRHKLKASKS